MDEKRYLPLSCANCADGSLFGFDFSFAFQPVVDLARGEVTS